MMRLKTCIHLLIGVWIFAGCGSQEEEVADSYSFTAEASPLEAGTVDPSAGTFPEGEEITVSASASEGWEFENWTGDIESDDNPLSFSISQNIHLTANFFDFHSEYAVTLTLSDADDEFDLEFGQLENAAQSDQNSPPPPPIGALHAWFERSGEKLLKDFRDDHEREAGWQLHYQAGSGDTITLSWQTEAAKMDGSLTLTDTSGSFQVDMKEEDSYEFGVDLHDYLVIEYRL